MEKISLILKERRQELGLSLSTMSEKTKLSIVQLEAIEKGDISFFKEDLSYLSYFVRYYANALDLDFNDIRNELDDSIMAYTSSVSVSKIKEKEAMTNRVIHKTHTKSRARKNIDLSSVGLFAMTALIIVLLAFAVFKIVIPAFQAKGPIEPPVVEVPGNEEETPETPADDKPLVEEPVKSKLVVKEVEPTLYEISGWKADEKLTINLDFNNKSWVGFAEDGAAMDAPSQGIYESGDNAQVIFNAKKDKILSFNVGYFKGNKFSLNGEEITINPDVATSPSNWEISFKLTEGASTE